jgi:hypothetical protein
MIIPMNPSTNCFEVSPLNSPHFLLTPYFHSTARTVTRKIRALRMRYWGHIRRRPENHILQVALRYTLPGNKKRGRPCLTWNNSHEADLEKYGEEVNFWKDISNDKTKLKNASNRIYELSESSEEDRELDE